MVRDFPPKYGPSGSRDVQVQVKKKPCLEDEEPSEDDFVFMFIQTNEELEGQMNLGGKCNP